MLLSADSNERQLQETTQMIERKRRASSAWYEREKGGQDQRATQKRATPPLCRNFSEYFALARALGMAEARQAAFNQKLQELAQQVADEAARKKFLAEMNNFRALVNSYLDKSRHKPIVWEKIKPPPEGMIRPLSALPPCPKDGIANILKKLAVVKLNGGLGTTMGCTGPKSVIEVRNEQTFLDLTVAQIETLNRTHGSSVPLVLMNSFNTHADTLKIIHKYKATLPLHTFNQSCYPRLVKESMLPMPDKVVGQNEAWYPPGHGDIFPAIFNSGVLDTLLAEGREYIFISNVDNLGATVDLNLLHHMVTSGSEFIMEVTDKTAADIKGGTLIEYEGRAKLLEIAQVRPTA